MMTALASMKEQITAVEAAWSDFKARLDVLPPKFRRELIDLIVVELKANEAAPVQDPKRCVGCGWPLREEGEDGCKPYDCCMRPIPNLEAYKKYLAGRPQAVAEAKGQL